MAYHCSVCNGHRSADPVGICCHIFKNSVKCQVSVNQWVWPAKNDSCFCYCIRLKGARNVFNVIVPVLQYHSIKSF